MTGGTVGRTFSQKTLKDVWGKETHLVKTLTVLKGKERSQAFIVAINTQLRHGSETQRNGMSENAFFEHKWALCCFRNGGMAEHLAHLGDCGLLQRKECQNQNHVEVTLERLALS